MSVDKENSWMVFIVAAINRNGVTLRIIAWGCDRI